METAGVRDLHDWITGFGSLQERMRAKLARPAPDYRAREARLSSAPLGWRDLGLEQHDLAPGAGSPPAKPGRHLVILCLGSGRIVLNGGAEAVVHTVRPGSVMLIPGNPDIRWSAGTPLSICVLTLDGRSLDRVAADIYRTAPRDFELLPMQRDYDFGVIGLAGVLAEEVMRGGRGNNLYVNSLASILAVHLLRHYAKWRRKEPAAERRTAFERALNAPEPVQRAVVHIRENHTRDIGVQEIAEAAGVNPFVLRRQFYESLGTEPGQYLLQLRMQSAESLLAAGARSLPEIAQAVGFGDQGALVGRQERQNGAAY
jgi:AraC family transcriptional regulator